MSNGRVKPAIAQARATGSKLRGRSSNRSSSTASNTAAIGVPKTAVIPATAPATSNVFRSPALTCTCCAMSEPMAPPVMIIGPSAPKGPPLPIAIADDNGFNTATFAVILLFLKTIASMASGIPWPRIASEPKRAISPMIKPPIIGTGMTHNPRPLRAGDRSLNDNV